MDCKNDTNVLIYNFQNIKYSIIHNRRGLKAKRLDFNAFEPFP